MQHTSLAGQPLGVVGTNLEDGDDEPLHCSNLRIRGSIESEMVDNFPYLGSNIASCGELTSEVTSQIANLKAFGCLKKSIFQNPNLSVSTKQAVYRAVVMSVLFYGALRNVDIDHARRLTYASIAPMIFFYLYDTGSLCHLVQVLNSITPSMAASKHYGSK